jgi:hypothetical protein
MAGKHAAVHRLVLLACLLPGSAVCAAQAVPAAPETFSGALSATQAQALVERALANELRAAQDHGHPMRYSLRKSSPRVTTTKEIIETRDGAVARLVSINDQPLSAADEQKEQARLDALMADPGLQHHRKQSEDTDTGRAVKVLRALPQAFVYQYAGSGDTTSGKVAKFSFKPNPAFSPPDLETEVLTAMSGTVWIDAAQARVARLDGHLDEDVDFGWGVLGLLHKGGWIAIEQAGVGGDQWRTTRFRMQMTGRVFFRTRVFDTTEDETQFEPVPTGLDYAQAIQMLLSSGAGGNNAGR